MNKILKTIPDDLENKLFEEYTEIKRCSQLSEHRPGQLSGGRFSEAMLRIFQHLTNSPITSFDEDIRPAKKDEIINRITNHPDIDKHIRQKVTVLTKLLMDFRNNRDVAHLGGFSANKIDSNFVLSCANWIITELIRVYGSYSMNDAQTMIDKLASPNYPVLFNIEGEEFIARDDLTTQQEILVLLCKEKREFNFLFSKTKDTNKSRVVQRLTQMKKDKFIALKDKFYYLLPKGIQEIQTENLLTYE